MVLMRRFSIWAAALSVSGGLFLSLVAAAAADTVGQSVTFRTDSYYDAQGASVVPATLRAVGQDAYFYVDDRAWAAIPAGQEGLFAAALDRLAAEFDSTIHPRATALWGSEATPGVDNDPRVTVVLERLIAGNGGYFETVNNYRKDQAPDSNAREMVFVSADSVLNGNAKNFLAHEFQHLISFNQKELLQYSGEDTWLNEARSEYDITVAGYSEPFNGSTLQRRRESFLRAPSDSLVEWPNTAADYAIASVFAHYLADRFGPQILSVPLHTKYAGVQSLDGWLAQSGQSEHFSDVFTDWMVASYLNDRTQDARYGYSRPGLADLHVSPQQSVRLDASSGYRMNTTLKEWQPLWLEMDMPVSGALEPTLTLDISGQAGTWWGGATIALYGSRRVVVPWTAPDGRTTLTVPTRDGNGSALTSVVMAVTQGSLVPVGERSSPPAALTVTASLASGVTPTVVTVGIGTPAPTPMPAYTHLKDGDLIRRPGENEVYVIWGRYRRYLPVGVLALYGFQDRPVVPVPDSVFDRYVTSNYVRAQSGKRVYALWPDGTKHWLNMTAAYFDRSGRDWGAIFIVNDAEVAFYRTGPDITQ